jgi:hypothetical protein
MQYLVAGIYLIAIPAILIAEIIIRIGEEMLRLKARILQYIKERL